MRGIVTLVLPYLAAVLVLGLMACGPTTTPTATPLPTSAPSSTFSEAEAISGLRLYFEELSYKQIVELGDAAIKHRGTGCEPLPDLFDIGGPPCEDAVLLAMKGSLWFSQTAHRKSEGQMSGEYQGQEEWLITVNYKDLGNISDMHLDAMIAGGNQEPRTEVWWWFEQQDSPPKLQS